MSVSIKVNIDAAATKAQLERITRSVEDRTEANRSVASQIESITGKRIREVYIPRDGPEDFWADVRDSIETEWDAKGATVSLNTMGIRLRYSGSAGLPGGGVTPGKSISSFTGKLTRALAVPSDAAPVRQGRFERPGRAGLLAFILAATRGDTVGYLVEGEEKTVTRGKNKGGKRIAPKPGGSLLYTLRSITRHRGDPGILPSQQAMHDAAEKGIRDILSRLS